MAVTVYSLLPFKINEILMCVSSIPDEPLKMPPPYWRSSGAIFHVLSSLVALVHQLHLLIPLNEQTTELLGEYFSRVPQPKDEDSEFGDICEPLWGLESQIKLNIEIAILMSAISAEDKLNQFLVFNFHRSVVEPLEKLSPPEKLQVSSGLLGHKKAKENSAYSALKMLTSWRNAFAHGHCVDRPTKSLHHNHLVSPPEYPGVPDGVQGTIEMVNGFVTVSKYLNSISQNPYTSGSSCEIDEIVTTLSTLKKFKFTGTSDCYDVSFEE
jgi:hypothetical protein